MPRQTKPMTARRRAPDQIDLFAPRRIRNSTVTSICNGIPTWKPPASIRLSTSSATDERKGAGNPCREQYFVGAPGFALEYCAQIVNLLRELLAGVGERPASS